jgi:bacteriorhodopsin
MAHASPIVVPALITCICLQFGIFAYNTVKSYQISIFKIDRVMAFINSLIPALPIVSYTTLLISYDDHAEPSLLPFFIEWSLSVPLLLINLGKLLHFNVIHYAVTCTMPVIMSLVGYASAHATEPETVFALFGVSGGLYLATMACLYTLYRMRERKKLQETNFPSFLEQNKLIVFKALFKIIAVSWNGYPLTFILWKTENITIEAAIVSFACLDFIAKGFYVLTLLAYKLMLFRQNGLIVRAFRRAVKVHPIPENLPSKLSTDETFTVTEDVLIPKIKPHSQIVRLDSGNSRRLFDGYPDGEISPLPTTTTASVTAV